MQLKLVKFLISLCALYISGSTIQWISALDTLTVRITIASISDKHQKPTLWYLLELILILFIINLIKTEECCYI